MNYIGRFREAPDQLSLNLVSLVWSVIASYSSSYLYRALPSSPDQTKHSKLRSRTAGQRTRNLQLHGAGFHFSRPESLLKSY